MAEDSDWRMQGQDKYLQGATLIRRAWRRPARNPNWDHDHCKFCWAKFIAEPQPDSLQEGYCTPDEYHWICTTCFEDFKARFEWKVIED